MIKTQNRKKNEYFRGYLKFLRRDARVLELVFNKFGMITSKTGRKLSCSCEQINDYTVWNLSTNSDL